MRKLGTDYNMGTAGESKQKSTRSRFVYHRLRMRLKEKSERAGSKVEIMTSMTKIKLRFCARVCVCVDVCMNVLA